jgi:hypothetical protein
LGGPCIILDIFLRREKSGEFIKREKSVALLVIGPRIILAVLF